MINNQELTPFNTIVKCADCGYENYEINFECKIRVNQANKQTEKDWICPKCKSYDLIYPKIK